jgi:hypothetical protein
MFLDGRTLPVARRVARRSTGVTAASGLLLVGLLAGCGSSSGSSSANPSSPASTDSSASASAGSAPTVEQLTGVLLTTDELDTTAKNSFTAGPASPDDSSSTGCAAFDDFQKASKGTEKVKAGRTYNTTDSKFSAEDDLFTVPGQAAALFTQLKSAAASCDTLTASGTKLALTKLADPSVDGSDDTLAIQATADVNGQTITEDIFMARFGDNLLQMSYGGVIAPADASTVGTALLTQAADKAKSVLTA